MQKAQPSADMVSQNIARLLFPEAVSGIDFAVLRQLPGGDENVLEEGKNSA